MNYYVNVSSKSLFKENEELCGDKVEVIRKEDSVIVIMSDGMGSGVKANILATLTCKIIGTMLREGATIEDTVETVINTLPVCNIRKVAYCTFTILQIFYDGKACLIEYDNPEIMFFRDKQKMKLAGEFREINGKKIKETRFIVNIGDIIAIVSDGIVHAGKGNVLNMGWQLENVSEFIEHFVKNGEDGHKICEMLSYTCSGLYGGKHKDDATAVLITVDKAIPASIMIGPPSSSDMDKAAVEELMYGNGIKIVCGGTTSRIVEKYINGVTDNVSLESGSELPPVTSMKGIDLITEGVLTLSKVSNILSKCMHDSEYMSILPIQDGAEKLASILVNKCTDIKLIIGTAENPAHRASDFRIDLNYKLQLVEEIANKLKSIGKRITIIYF